MKRGCLYPNVVEIVGYRWTLEGLKHLLDAGVLDGDALSPPSGERATDVTVESRLRVENSDGEALARAEATDSATVTVEREVSINAAEYGSVGGTGGLTIETAE